MIWLRLALASDYTQRDPPEVLFLGIFLEMIIYTPPPPQHHQNGAKIFAETKKMLLFFKDFSFFGRPI